MFANDTFDCRQQGCAQLRFTKMVQHHRDGPNCGDRIGDAFARDVGCRAVDRLEEAWVMALGIEVGAWRKPHAAGNSCAEISDNIAEQVRGHDHIQTFRRGDKTGAQRINQLLFVLNIRILGGDLAEYVVPEDQQEPMPYA